MADHLAVLNMPMAALKRSATVTSFDPFTLLPALATVTSHIGLIATASTSYNEPYHIARKFASLDHISGGRAGWNVVTSANPHEALNFGREQHLEHAERYKRAREFYAVVTGLWDSWADDAFIRDRRCGRVFRSGAHACARPQGRRVRGARPAQCRASGAGLAGDRAGRQLGSRAAAGGRDRRDGVLGRRRTGGGAGLLCRRQKPHGGVGRDPEHLKIMPGAFVVLGGSQAEAEDRKARLDALVHPDSGISSLSVMLGCDVSGFALDGPLPELPESNASRGSRDKLVAMARDKHMTVRQLAQWVGGAFGILEMIGTPAMVADQMQEWLEHACLRWLQRDVPVPAGRTRRFRGGGGAGTPAPRHFPPRLQRPHVARTPRPAASRQPVLPRATRLSAALSPPLEAFAVARLKLAGRRPTQIRIGE
jgi:alkanesulfonate monooxygenase SsuD/methylene tetrahydromethanopterin reductase-like flavin-dependent oxidoreductase (luciferase family)